MSSRVTKSLPLLVGPAEATPACTVQLTAMDTALASMPMSAVFIFHQPIDQAAETVRRALSRALVPYYPIAGRLTPTVQNGLAIACTGEGVAFVAAKVSSALPEARLTDRQPAIPVEELTVTYAGQNVNGNARPLLLMQVTEFSCGGFVIGVTWDHVIADGVGMAQFLQAVGEFARGRSSPSVVPVRLDYSPPDVPPAITSMAKSIAASAHNEFPNSYITVPMSFINRIKAEFLRQDDDHHAGVPCSSFEAFVAAIWKCRARAIISPACADQWQRDAPMTLAFTANARKQADAKNGYYGNLLTFGLAVATYGEVANGDIVDLVKLVKEAKALVAYTFMDGDASIAGEIGARLHGLPIYDTLYITSWWNLGFDDIDIGAGGPVRVMGSMERRVVPVCILCGRKDKADGVAAMAMCVREEHEERFRAELHNLIG